MEIIKEEATDAWIDAIKKIREEGETIKGEREIVEVPNMIITVKNPNKDITRPVEILRGLKNIVYPELNELEDVIFRKEASKTQSYTYGARIFNYSNTKDQVEEFIIPLLKKDPSTKRAIIVLYQPLHDSKISSQERPCLISIHFRMNRGRLNVSAVLRSNEMLMGWPANIYQISLLQKRITDEVGAETGTITTISHSAHIYKDYEEQLDEVLRKT
jgi:thymidylate synthase